MARVLRAAAAAALLTLAPAQAHAHDLSRGSVAEVDRRPQRPAEVPSRVRDARATLGKELGRQALLATDPGTGGVRVAARLDGFLTPAASGDPAAIALRYVREHADVFGLDADDLRRLRLARRSVSPAGVTRLIWAQTSRGVPVHGAELRASVDRRGRVVNVLGAPLADATASDIEPGLGAATVMAVAHREAGSTARVRPRDAGRGPERVTRFRDAQSARLVLLATGGTLTLAWRLQVRPRPGAAYDEIRDAATGNLLVRRSLVSHATALVWEDGPGPQTKRDITAYVFPAPQEELCGPFACTHTDYDDDGVVDDDERVQAGPDSFEFAYAPVTAPDGQCPALGCSWDHDQGFSWQANRSQSAVQAHYLVSRAHDHLKAPPIGFDADDGAFEGGTSVRVRTHVGIDPQNGLPTRANNGFMESGGPGFRPVMTLLLGQADGSGFRDLNLADDADMIYHEYAHGFNSRLIADAAGMPALGGDQGGAMDEGTADFLALDRLYGDGLRDDDPASGDVRWAPKLTIDDPRAQMRYAPLDCPASISSTGCPGTSTAGPGGFTFGDFGDVMGFPESHADGEIWAQTLWDLRRRMIADHGAANGLLRIRELLAEGMRLAPADPSMLDLRNAILQADTVTGGGDRDALWEVFAARGMGWFASTVDAYDLEPVEDFSTVPANGPVAPLGGIVSDSESEVGLPGAKVSVGGHSTTGLSANLEATTGADGGYSVPAVPTGTYRQLFVRRPGYDTAILRDVEVGPSGAALDVPLRRDFADVLGGAQVTDTEEMADCPASAALDENRGRGWAAAAGAPRSFTVKLAATADVTDFAVDPRVRCRTFDPTASASDYRIEVSTTGVVFREVAAGTFGKADLGGEQLVALPAPEKDVNYVRFTALANQGLDPDELGWFGYEQAVGISSFSVHATVHDPPKASLQYAPRSPMRGDTVEFDASESTMDGGGLPKRFEWDLDGNGSYELDTKATPTASRRYTEPGRVYVRVRVTDDRGLTSVRQRIMSVDSDAVISELGTLGGDEAFALDINEAGQITGGSRAVAGGPARAFLYDGVMYDRGSLDAHAQGNVVNDAGAIVGWSDNAAGTAARATRFDAAGPVALDDRPGYESLALGMNNAGAIVGWAEVDVSGQPGVKRRTAHAFSPLTPIDFSLPGWETLESEAADVNASGDVVGQALVTKDGQGRRVAFLRRAGQTIDLGGLGGAFAQARVINDKGEIAGHAEDALGVEHAFLWDQGLMIDLGGLGGSEIIPLDISEKGTIVGNGLVTGGIRHAFVVRDYVVTDLNDLLPHGSGWVLESADGINERNEVVGYGSYEGQRRAYMLDLDGCDLCVEKLELEHRDLPTGAWKTVGHEGTVDGNLVRVKATVRNRGTEPLIANVKLREDGAEIPGAVDPVALDPGQTETRVLELETDGKAWKDGVPASDRIVRAELTVGNSVLHRRGVDLKVRPRPIIAVHGLNSSAETWAPYPAFAAARHPDWEVFAVGDGRDGGFPRMVMNTGSVLSSLSRPNTIAENAAVLATYVKRVRERLDAAHVDVVAHSMGGLITRRYLHSLMPESPDLTPVVRHLVMLGSPLMGSPCATLFAVPTTHELRPDVVAKFNAEVTDRKGVPFTNLVGEYMSFTCQSDEDGDSVVPISSARWTLPESALLSDNLIHTGMTADQPTFVDYVTPRLNGEFPYAPASRAAARADAPGTPAPQLVTYEELSVTGTRELPLAVTGGSRLTAALAGDPRVAAQLIDPAGAVAATLGAGEGGPLRALGVDAPAAGAWKLRLESPVAGPVEMAASVALAGGTRAVSLAAPAVDGNDATVALTLTEGGQPVTGAAASARFVGIDGEHDRVLPLFDTDGDGVYSGTIERLAKGRYSLLAEADKAGWTMATTGIAEVTSELPPLPPVANGRIAFARPASIEPDADQDAFEIFTVQPDGTGLAELTGQIPGRQREPRFTTDGERIHFDHLNAVYVMNADGTGARGISMAGHGSAPQSPVADRLAFEAKRFSEDCGFGRVLCSYPIGLVSARTDGRGARVFGDGDDPSWLADGSGIVLQGVGPADNHPEYEQLGAFERWGLWTVGVDGRGWRQLTADNPNASDCRLDDADPDVSPDGRYVLMSRADCRPDRVDTRPEIAVLDTLEGTVSYLTDTDEVDEYDPVWSPDGTRIAYVARYQGEAQERGTELMVMDADGGNPKTVTKTSRPYGSAGGSLDWQPLYVEEEPAPPVCAGASVAVVHDTATQLPLTCTDGNGDALALSIVTGPAHGTLGEIDQAAGRVLYTPAAGYEGADSLTFKAAATDGESAPATVTIAVGAGPEEPPPPDEETLETPIPAPTAPVTPPTGGGGGGGNGPLLPSGGGGGGGGTINPPSTCLVECNVQVQCPTGARCDGDISGRGGVRTSRVTASAARGAKALVKRVRFSVPGGATKKVKVKLTAYGKKQLKRRKRLRVPIRMTLRQAGVVTRRDAVLRFRRR